MRIDRDSLTRYAELRLRATARATSLQQGDRRSPFLGRGVEFADYRPYDASDDIRLIDWNVYLRLGTALIRQFNEERSLSSEIFVDVSASMDFGRPLKADHAAQLTAALAVISLAHRDPVTVCCYGGERPVRARASNLEGLGVLLHLLERVEPGGHADAYAQISSQLGTARVDRLVLITDLLVEDDRRESLLRLLAASSHQPVLLHVLSAEELQPALDAMYQVVDAETDEALIVRDDRLAQRTYAEHLEGWIEAIRTRCRTLGIRYVAAHNPVTVSDLVTGELRRASLVEHAAGGDG
jgi:uncharacterized protein (DUF58 family)